MRIDQDDDCLSRSGVSQPRLCYLAIINDQRVLHTSDQEPSSCHQPRLSADDALRMRMTEEDCSFREIDFEDKSTRSLGLPGGLARSPLDQVVSLGDLTTRFGLKSSPGNLNGNAIFVSSLHLLKGVRMESVSGESLNNKTNTSF